MSNKKWSVKHEPCDCMTPTCNHKPFTLYSPSGNPVKDFDDIEEAELQAAARNLSLDKKDKEGNCQTKRKLINERHQKQNLINKQRDLGDELEEAILTLQEMKLSFKYSELERIQSVFSKLSEIANELKR